MKKQTKRILSLALALVMCLGLGASALAYEEDEYPAFTTEFQGDAWAQETLDSQEAGLLSYYLLNQLDYPLTIDCTRPISRAEFAGVILSLWEYRENYPNEIWYGDAPESPFTDTEDTYVLVAHSQGLVNGTSETTFNPNDPLTREQAATLLTRVLRYGREDVAQSNTTFADDAQIGSWAKAGVSYMAGLGIINGVGDNRFAPQQTLSIQEALVLAVRSMEVDRLVDEAYG